MPEAMKVPEAMKGPHRVAHESRGSNFRGIIPVCIVVELVILAPVIITVVKAFGGGIHQISSTLSSGNIVTLIEHTLSVSLIATPICAIVGVGSAWLVVRTDLPGRKVWMICCVAPLTIPPFLTSFAWVGLSSSMQGILGAVAVTVFTYFPLVFLVVSAALRGLDPALEECSTSMGKSSLRTFFTVILPQLKPAILGGVLLVVLDSLVEFDAFAAMKFQTFSTDIYSQFETSFSVTSASILSLISILLCIAVLYGEHIFRGKSEYARLGWGVRASIYRLKLGKLRYLAFSIMLLLGITSIGIPVGSVIHWFLTSSKEAILSSSQGVKYLSVSALTSIGLGVGGAVIAIFMALPIAIYISRYQSKVSVLFERGTYMAFALPDLVGAIALSYAASHWVAPLYETIPLLLIAYAILFVPLGLVAIRVVLGQIEGRLYDASFSLGSGSFKTLWRVILPIARPGLAAAGVMVFTFVLGDLSTTQILLPPGMYTLGTQFWSNATTVAFDAAAPYALALLVISGVTTYLLMSRFGKVAESALR